MRVSHINAIKYSMQCGRTIGLTADILEHVLVLREVARAIQRDAFDYRFDDKPIDVLAINVLDVKPVCHVIGILGG